MSDSLHICNATSGVILNSGYICQLFIRLLSVWRIFFHLYNLCFPLQVLFCSWLHGLGVAKPNECLKALLGVEATVCVRTKTKKNQSGRGGWRTHKTFSDKIIYPLPWSCLHKKLYRHTHTKQIWRTKIKKKEKAKFKITIGKFCSVLNLTPSWSYS